MCPWVPMCILSILKSVILVNSILFREDSMHIGMQGKTYSIFHQVGTHLLNLAPCTVHNVLSPLLAVILVFQILK